MIIAIIIVIFSLAIFVSLKSSMDDICKKIIIVYLVLTGGILCISNLNPVGLNKVSIYTYILWIINVLSFTITFIFFSLNYIKEEKKDSERYKTRYNKIFNSKILLIVEIIEMLLLIYYFIKYITLIGTINNSQIRIARFTMLFGSAFETLFYNYIIGGMLSITSIMLVIMLLRKDFKNPILWISIINVVLYTFIGFGRMTVFTVIIYFMLGIIFSNRKSKITKKQIFGFSLLVLIMFTLFVSIICVRMYDVNKSLWNNIKIAINNQLKQTLEYFLGGLRTLDEFLENGFVEFDKHTYGRATFAGLDEIVLYFPKGVGAEINSFNNLANGIMSNPHQIGKDTNYFNAFYTCVMNYYLDFGILGVVLFPALHAMFIVYIVKQFYKEDCSGPAEITLYYVVGNLMFTVLKWNYQGGSNVFVLVILLIGIQVYNKVIHKKEKKYESSLDS